MRGRSWVAEPGRGGPDGQVLVGVGVGGEDVPVQDQLADHRMVEGLRADGAAGEPVIAPPLGELLLPHGQFTDQLVIKRSDAFEKAVRLGSDRLGSGHPQPFGPPITHTHLSA
jgi:hypothetical protein